MRKFTWLLALAVPVTIISCQKDVVQAPANEDEALVQGQAVTGNGSTSGKHYNLNIIGVDNPKTFNYDEEMQNNTTGNGHRIFVNMNGRTKINLAMGDFDVLDANGTDGIAAFQLPKPDADENGTNDYAVFVRGLGKPGGKAQMQSCYSLPDGDDADTDRDEYCSTSEYIVDIEASKGGSKFQNVTNQLLYVWVDLDADGDADDRVALFSDELAEYYWYYYNSGLRLAQMRFYPGVESPVPADPNPDLNM